MCIFPFASIFPQLQAFPLIHAFIHAFVCRQLCGAHLLWARHCPAENNTQSPCSSGSLSRGGHRLPNCHGLEKGHLTLVGVRVSLEEELRPNQPGKNSQDASKSSGLVGKAYAALQRGVCAKGLSSKECGKRTSLRQVPLSTDVCRILPLVPFYLFPSPLSANWSQLPLFEIWR